MRSSGTGSWPVARPFSRSCLRPWPSYGRFGRYWTKQRHAAQRLDPLGDGVHQLTLFIEVFVEEQVELVERRSADLPVVPLVEVPHGHGVGEELVEILDTGGAGRGVEGDGQPGYRAVGL